MPLLRSITRLMPYFVCACIANLLYYQLPGAFRSAIIISDRSLTPEALLEGFFLPSNLAATGTDFHNNSSNNNGTGATSTSEAVRDKKLSQYEPPSNFTEYQTKNSTSGHHASNVSNHRQDTKQFHSRPIVSPCSPGRMNSMTWLQKPRAEVNPDGISQELERLLINGPTRFDMIPDLLRESLCHGSSSFCNIPTNVVEPSLSAVKEWLPRLFFLALQWRFHQPALQEFQRRESCSVNQTYYNAASTLPSYGNGTADRTFHLPGPLEYECPTAKFLVMNLSNVGFGAVLNSIVLYAILTAFRSGRIPVLWAEQQRWLLAPSDCTSGDMQCYFLPFSPCTLSKSDVNRAQRLGVNKPDQRSLRRSMEIPPEFQNDRVVVVDIGLIPPPLELQQMHDDIISTTVAVSRELLHMWKKNSAENKSPTPADESTWRVIELAIDFMQRQKTIQEMGYEATYVYMLRPNPVYKRVLLNHTTSILPPFGDYKRSVGLPIRGSDKCRKESTCLAFETFMDLASDTYREMSSLDDPFSTLSSPSHRPKLVVTTEDPAIFHQANAFRLNESLPYELILNENDNLQGSGAPKMFSRNQSPNDVAKDTIVSSLVSLQMQLTPGTVYANCCSNWHKVMWKFIMAGCGAHPDTTFKCLNEAPPPMNNSKYRLCCEWKKDTQCKELYKAYKDREVKE